MSGTAANVRSGKFEIVAEEIHQAGSRIDRSRDCLCIHRQRQLSFHDSSSLMFGVLRRRKASASARLAATRAIERRYSEVP